MSALERAEQDIERGDYGLARQRLTSYLSNKGYDADLAARIGRLCFDMRDMYQAGRYWLLSTAEGDDVDEAVAVFLKRAGTDSKLVVAELPRILRLPDLDAYPEPVRRRLSTFGLEDAVAAAGRHHRITARASWGGRGMAAGCLLGFVIIIALFVIGLGTVVAWLFDL